MRTLHIKTVKIMVLSLKTTVSKILKLLSRSIANYEFVLVFRKLLLESPGWQKLAAFRRAQKWPHNFLSDAYLLFLRQMRRFCTELQICICQINSA